MIRTTDPALSPETREHLESRLQEERRRREDTRDTALAAAPDTPGGSSEELSDLPSHPADAAHHADEVDRDQRAAERSTGMIRRIDAALARLRREPESYGRCRVCEAVIATERLDLLPWTEHCARHAPAGEE